MAQFRPAGFSDEDSDSDDCGFYEKPSRSNCPVPRPNLRLKVEHNLQDAIVNGNMKEIEKIVICELKHNVNWKFESGWTPLMHACFHAQEKIVQFFLDRGADPNLHSDSLTPLMAVCSNSSADGTTVYNIAKSLLDKNCVVNVGDKHGQTALMRAIGSGRVAVAKKLLDYDINIEMRDQQGWTALFWTAHHNQPEIMNLLIERGARLTEVDRYNRTPLDIANSHEFQTIIDILESKLKADDVAEEAERNAYVNMNIKSWHDYYPGIYKGEKPNYIGELPQLLYGMNCERLLPLIIDSGMDLRTFLLLQENDMIDLGIDLPYERQRLMLGLRNFHTRGWKLKAVAGLYARNTDNYSAVDCLTALGAHLQQLYILETTLQYILCEYNKIQSQIKFEPPDSPLLIKMKIAAKKILINIKSIRREVSIMKTVLIKISKSNPQPADLIREKSVHEIAIGYIPDLVIIFSLGFLAFQSRHFVTSFLKQ